jgi:predicted RNA polymerase sigma factor
VVALERWPVTGVPDNALSWLIGVARSRMTAAAAAIRAAPAQRPAGCLAGQT